MAGHAIVIGVGAYRNPQWDLPAAVPDALRFKDWVIQHGGVAASNVRLLLSPWPDDLPGFPQKSADRRTIVQAVQEFQDGQGKGGDRLFFYYAGHGVSAPGVTTGGMQEPVIIPADVESLRVDAGLLIGFSELMPLFLDCEPKEQFFFIDACREFALEDEFQPGVGRSGIRWSPPNREAGPRSAQYVLYSTSPGLRAYEDDRTARGVFADALLAALGGVPKATQWSPAEAEYVVRWSSLVRYLRDVVTEQFAPPAGSTGVKPAYIQLPEPETRGGDGDPELFRVAESDMGKLDLTVQVRPSKARKNGKVKVVVYVRKGVEVALDETGPPLSSAHHFTLAPGDYAIEASAEDFAPKRVTCALWEPSVAALELSPPPLEMGEHVRFIERPTTGRLYVSSSDPGPLLAVWDGEHHNVAMGSGYVTAALPPGIYRIQKVLPGQTEERTAEVRAGTATTVEFAAGDPDVGATQLAQLEQLDIRTGPSGALYPSESLGGFGDARLASVLGLAAFPATGPFRGQFEHLSRLGVELVSDAAAGMSPVVVLLGASRDEPLPGVDVTRLLQDAEIVARGRDGSPVDQGGFTPLAAFPSAAQRTFTAPTGPLTIELRLPGAGATRTAVTCLPDRRSVLVVVAEGGGAFDVQQYSIPLSAEVPGASALLNSPSNVRLLEIAQRYYSVPTEPIPEHTLEELLMGKWFDPLFGALAGYGLIGQGRAERFRGAQSSPGYGPDDIEPSAMRNMLKFFPGLPDSHVLAGLCEPERRAEHYQRALEAGMPVFSEGLRVLHRWFRDAGEVPAVLAEPSRRLVPGSPWTSWVATRPALAVREGTFGPAPLGWDELERNRAAITRTIAAVGRFEVVDSPHGHAGTAFLVSADLVLTTNFVADAMGPGQAARIDFAEEEGSSERRECAVTGEIAVDEERWLALLSIEPAPSWIEPLRLARSVPSEVEGRAVYVVGFPMHDPRVEPGVQRSVFDGEASGVKRLQPGQLLRTSSTGKVVHDCFTLGGNAGSPLVDLASGLVLGVHHSGRWLEYKEGTAQALWDLADTPLFRNRPVTWS